MRVGIFTRIEEIFSMRVYRENVTRELSKLGVEFIELDEMNPRDETLDLVWDHQAFAGRPPLPPFLKTSLPCVATQHGARPLVLSQPELSHTEMQWRTVQAKVATRKKVWDALDKSSMLYIAISKYAAREIVDVVGLRADRITLIHHGVDHDVFHPAEGRGADLGDFLLHISQYQPVKNLDRILDAYASIPSNERQPLRVVSTGYGAPPDLQGLHLTTEPVSEEELVDLYQRAMGFLFPSLHEGFGFPIVEAMACGCPVLTSTTTACAETAGDAAILVDPRSVEEIAAGIRRLGDNPDLRAELRGKGIQRAGGFTWASSAKKHHDVFRKAKDLPPRKPLADLTEWY